MKELLAREGKPRSGAQDGLRGQEAAHVRSIIAHDTSFELVRPLDAHWKSTNNTNPRTRMHCEDMLERHQR